MPVPEDYVFSCSQRGLGHGLYPGSVDDVDGTEDQGGCSGSAVRSKKDILAPHVEPRKPVQGAYWVVARGDR